MDSDLIKEVKDCVEASEATYKTWRTEAKEDLLMKAGEAHWPGNTAATRESEGRPCLTVNQLGQFSARVTGEFRLNQFAINIKPADSVSDPGKAQVLEGLVRSIQYDSLAKVAYRFGLQNAADCGLGWLRVAREYESWDAWDQVLKILPVYNPFSVYPDAASVRYDLEDCWRLAVLEEMPVSVYTARWPKAGTEDIDGGTGNKKRTWANEKDKTITVAEYWRKVPATKELALVGPPGNASEWRTVVVTKEVRENFYQEGDRFFIQDGEGLLPVHRLRTVKAHVLEVALVSGADVLEKPKEEPGRYFPLVPVFGEEVHVDGQRRLWGVIRHAKEPQRICNYQWTAAVEAVGFQPKVPWLVTSGMIAGHEDVWAAANRTNVPYLVYEVEPSYPQLRPERQAPPVTPVAALALVEKSEAMLRSTSGGIYDSALGQRSNESSGIAIQKRQVATQAATATYPDNLALAMEHLGRILLDQIPHVYDNERTIRILGDDFAKTETVRINGSGGPDITQGRYDVIATIGPSYATRRDEAFTSLNEFAQKVLGPDSFFIADKIVQLSDSPERDAIVERVKRIQAMKGFSEDGKVPPAMMEGLMKALQQAVPQMVQQSLAQLMGQMGGPRG